MPLDSGIWEVRIGAVCPQLAQSTLMEQLQCVSVSQIIAMIHFETETTVPSPHNIYIYICRVYQTGCGNHPAVSSVGNGGQYFWA